MVSRHDAEAIRLYLLGTHYRHPLEFSDERIEEAGRALARLRALQQEAERPALAGAPAAASEGLAEQVAAHRARFEQAMDDDFNTPQALGVLFDLARVLNAERAAQGPSRAFLAGVSDLSALGGVLGLLQRPAGAPASLTPEFRARVDALVEQRQAARKQRNFAEADRLRGEIAALGVLLEDSPGGTTWKLRS
jgi:cysteinyl-tRNA synthetase